MTHPLKIEKSQDPADETIAYIEMDVAVRGVDVLNLIRRIIDLMARNPTLYVDGLGLYGEVVAAKVTREDIDHLLVDVLMHAACNALGEPESLDSESDAWAREFYQRFYQPIFGEPVER